MHKPIDDFHDPHNYDELPDSEQKIIRRNHRKEEAIEQAWDYFLTRGDPENGYRLPLNSLAESIKVGVSAERVEKYLKESSSWDPLDPFEKEWVTVAGSPTLYIRPKHQKALEARLRDKGIQPAKKSRPRRQRKGGANA